MLPDNNTCYATGGFAAHHLHGLLFGDHTTHRDDQDELNQSGDHQMGRVFLPFAGATGGTNDRPEEDDYRRESEQGRREARRPGEIGDQRADDENERPGARILIFHCTPRR